MMYVEIFGFNPNVMNCPSCMRSKALCELNDINYEFHCVVSEIHKGKLIYDNAVLEDLDSRIERKEGESINVPRIFVDDVLIGGLSDFRAMLRDLNMKTNEVI
ncbi:MAG: hypothetical protein ACRCWQ_02250 [Bacilli bacterium]